MTSKNRVTRGRQVFECASAAHGGGRAREHRRVSGRWLGGICTCLLLGLCASAARARELWSSSDMQYSLALDTAFKATWLLSHAPDDPLLFPERTTETGLFRLRMSLDATLGPHVDAQLSYEHRAQLMPDGNGLAGSALLPPTAPAPFRVVPLDQALLDRPTVTHHHELDRAFVALHLAPFELTLGRQALGLGRGVLFSAVDVFSPFSPLEVDREWRRGVDAAHAELNLDSHLSADVIGAADRHFRDGALLARVRGYFGDLDAALIGGKRAEDLMLGAVASAAVADAELHGEAAWFWTDGTGFDRGWLGSDRWVAKFVAGASYQFNVGRGLRLLGEYHYSGFGLSDVANAPGELLDPAFQRRLLRGDTQILGRHVITVVLSYDLTDLLSSSVSPLLSPVDGSGLVAATFTYRYSDTVTLLANGYVAWGDSPRMGIPRSEYGADGITGLLQVRIYD